MAKAIRVHEVAKELGVESKAIVDKCQAEGVPGITNHMSVVKLGLAQTIREWFSASSAEQGTAVEVAEKVDLGRVRRPARRKAASPATSEMDAGAVVREEEKPEGAETAAEVESAPQEQAEPAVAEQPAAAAAAAAAEEPAVEPVEEAEPAAEAAVAEQPAAEPARPAAAAAAAAPVAESKPQPAAAKAAPKEREAKEAQVQAQSAAQVQPMGRPNVPDRPAVVKPVGQKLERPTGAVLRGPKVVRVEQPDTLAPPRPRRPAGAGGGGGDDQRASDGAVPGISRSRGPVRGRGAGAAQETEGEGSAKGAGGKRRSLTTRRGRFAEALPTGPSKFTEQDLIELDARLKRATGFVKQRRRDLRKRDNTPMANAASTGGRVEVSEPIFIKDLSAATGIKTSDIIKYLFRKGIMATINSAIDTPAAQEVAMEYDIDLVVKEAQTAEQRVIEEFENQAAIDVRPAPPSVAVLGHVDHGKTSLLDRIRRADVAAHEAGGITQHVGAYRVTVPGNDGEPRTVVFLDTPGHEAFTSMRARGASIVDIVVLVVAADDGVMPQTVESINHAKAAGVPIVVALNKIDRPEATEANIRKIYGQLAEHGLNPVDWGGTTEIVKVSAIQGTGITELLEVLDYQADLLELQADFGGPARGTVIEAQMQPGRGPVARVLVQAGMMKVGDFIVIGRAFGRVRDMTDEHGKNVREAGPATPLELSGIDVVCDAGDKFYVTDSLQKAEEVARQYRERERHEQLANQSKVTLDTFAAHVAAGASKELRVVLKADVQGSVDVLRQALSELKTEEVSVRVLHGAVGGITESDVLLADASDAVIVGFHVVASNHAKELAEQRNVEIRLYRIIYELIDDVKKALEGMLEPELREQVLGQAEVREVFKITKVGSVAGCLVTEGSIQRNGKMRVTRDGVVVVDDRQIESLRRVKDDVKEVRAGTECGIRLTGFDDVKVGDVLVCYNVTSVQRKLGQERSDSRK